MPSYVFAQEKPDGWLNEEGRKKMMETGVVIEQHQMKIIFEVGKSSSIHVKHVIEQGGWNDRPRIIEILPGPHTNLSVTDDEGDRLAFSFDGDTFEESDHIRKQLMDMGITPQLMGSGMFGKGDGSTLANLT